MPIKGKESYKPAAKKRSSKPGPKGITIEQIAKALRSNIGFISYAAAQLGVAPGSLSDRIRNNPSLKQIREEIDEQNLDVAESKLLELIEGGDLGAICFFLKCKGKSRGYVEKQIIEQTIEHSVKSMLDEDIDKELEKLESEA